MAPQLSLAEMSLVDKLVRKERDTPKAVLQAVNAARAKKGQTATNKSTIYRYVNGETHRKGDEECPPSSPLRLLLQGRGSPKKRPCALETNFAPTGNANCMCLCCCGGLRNSVAGNVL